MLFNKLELGSTAGVVIALAILLMSGFLATRVTKLLKLPNVTAYIFAGIIIGPFGLALIPQSIVSGMDFVTDVALALIAFGAGGYLKLANLRHSGIKIITITIFEAIMAAAVVTLTMLYIVKLPLDISLLLGAIGSATAPASTIMTIRQYGAKGEFVDMILQIVALDDAVALLAFSVCAAVIQASGTGAVTAAAVLMPIAYNLGSVVIGALLGVLLARLISDRRTMDNRLILTLTFILLMTGICDALAISPLLSCMALGTAYINVKRSDELFLQMNHFSPPILELFFVLSGMRLNLISLQAAGIVGVVYFFARILGKYLGAFTGAQLCGASKSTRNCLGLALIPQAGVSIGLAILGERLLPPEAGKLLSTIILSSAVIYEMVGPICAKSALVFSGAISRESIDAQNHIPAVAENS